MNTVPAFPATLTEEEPEGKRGLPSLLFGPFWPFRIFTALLQEELAALLEVRNQIREELAVWIFPQDDAVQNACRLSKVCSERTSRVLDQNPWLIFWYRTGLQRLAVEHTSELVCHRHCAACHQGPVARPGYRDLSLVR